MIQGKLKDVSQSFFSYWSFFVDVYKMLCLIKEKPVEYFKEISFPYLEDITREKGFLLEQHSLVLMDTF